MIVLLFLYFAGVNCQAPIDDQYVLNFDSPVYVCPDMASQSWVDTSGVEVERYNETTAYMTGKINFLKGLDHSTMVELQVYKEISGRYEMTISHEICDLCKEVGKPDSIYYKYLKYFGFPDACPFKAGTYTVQNLKPDGTDMPVNAVTSGRYQRRIRRTHTDKRQLHRANLTSPGWNIVRSPMDIETTSVGLSSAIRTTGYHQPIQQPGWNL